MLDLDSAPYWNWRYQQLLPKRHRVPSGVAAHTFYVLDPWHRPYPLYESAQSEIVVDQAARCAVIVNDRFIPLLIPKSDASRLFEAILLLGRTMFSGNRTVRYMNLFKAYEAIAEQRAPEFAAIRHALSHPTPSLTRKSTVQTLRRLFGGTTIELGCYAHERQFFLQFGQLLIMTDRLVGAAIHRRLPDWIRLNRVSRL